MSRPAFSFCLTFLCALLTLSCTVKADLEKYPGLKERVAQYYLAEQNHDWEQTYNLRTPDFKKIVSKEMYISHMRKDSAGWKLKKYDIKSIKENDGKVSLTINFVEEPPPNSFYNEALLKKLPPNTPPLKTFEMEDDSIWVRINGEWYCYAAGQRLHLPMNAPNS
ncbi:MAG: hypothetical protein ACYC9L_15820 [Sulfuricaulis sp.]